MKKVRLNRTHITGKNLLFILLLTAGIFAAVFAIFPNNDTVEIINEQSRSYNESWQLSGQTHPIDLPYIVPAKAGEAVTISKTIEDVFDSSGMSISFMSSVQSVTVSVDGEELYRFNQEEDNYLSIPPPPAWHIVRLSPDMIGKTLSITFVSPLDHYGGVLNSIEVGSKFSNVMSYMQQRLLSLVLSLIIFVFGLVAITLYLTLNKKIPDMRGLMYLGIFSCLVAVWSACETKSLQLFTGNVQLIMALTFLSIQLAPIPLLLFFRDRFAGRLRLLYNGMIVFFSVQFLLMLLMQATGVVSVYIWFFFFLALFALCLLIIVITLIYNYMKERSTQNKIPLLAMIFLITFAAADFLRYTVGRLALTSNADSTLFVRIGILLFIISLACMTISKMIGYYTDSVMAHTYKILANTDSLTGLHNRTYLKGFYRKVFSNCIRDQKSFAVIVVDIDNFKNYNDHYGHIMGDEVIRAVAEVLKESICRPLDGAIRYGGEEFLMVLPGIDTIGAITVADRVRFKLAALNLRHNYSNAANCITVSQGIFSAVPSQGAELRDFINLADKALYRAKAQGKDQYTTYCE